MIAFLPVALAIATGPPRFDSLHDKIPYDVAWGPYKVRVDYDVVSGVKRVVIRDHGGKIVRDCAGALYVPGCRE